MALVAVVAVVVASFALAVGLAAPAAGASTSPLLDAVNAHRSTALVRDAVLESRAASCVAQMRAADTVERCADGVGSAPDPGTLAASWFDYQKQSDTVALFAASSNLGGCAFDGSYGACNVAYVAPPKPAPKPSPKPVARRSVRRAQASSGGSGGIPEKEQSPAAIPTPTPVPIPTPSFTPLPAAAMPSSPAAAPSSGLPVAAVVAVGIVGVAAFAHGIVRGRRRRTDRVDLAERLTGPGSAEK